MMGGAELLGQVSDRGPPGPLKPEVTWRKEGRTKEDGFFRYLLNAFCTPEDRRVEQLPHLPLPPHTASFPSVGNQGFRPVLSAVHPLYITSSEGSRFAKEPTDSNPDSAICQLRRWG